MARAALLPLLGTLAFASGYSAQGYKTLVPSIRSPAARGDELVVAAGTLLKLRCEGAGPLRWEFPQAGADSRQPRVKERLLGRRRTVSTLRRPRAAPSHTGYYDCAQRDGPHGDFLYVYVQSSTDPWVNDRVYVSAKEFDNVVLDCRPNNPHTKVRLLDKNYKEVPLGEDAADGSKLSWHPRKGFLWANVKPHHSGRYYCAADGFDPRTMLLVDVSVTGSLKEDLQNLDWENAEAVYLPNSHFYSI